MTRITLTFTLGAFAAGLAAAAPPSIETNVVSQLACPLAVTKLVAVYGDAGAKYKPGFYADTNPEKTVKLWVYGVFRNTGDDPITAFTCDVLVWDAAGKEIMKSTEVFDLPLRDRPEGKEWSWASEAAAGAARVVFIPRVIRYPAGRTWEADERFVKGKLDELRAGAGQ